MRFGLSFEEDSKEGGLKKEWYTKPPPHLPHPDQSMRGLGEVEAKTHGLAELDMAEHTHTQAHTHC